MRSSCVTPPPNDALVIVRSSFVEICGGDVCAAALLNHLIYWHNVKLDQRYQAIAANEIAERHGESKRYEITLTQWHTESDLQRAMLGAWGTKKIRDGLRTLQDNHFIAIFRNPNGRFAFDKTKHFLVFPDAIQTALNRLNETEQPTAKIADGTAKIEHGASKMPPQLYIENTSKTSSSGKEADDDGEKRLDPFYSGQVRAIAREVVKQTRASNGKRNFFADGPWGALAEETGSDPKDVFVWFRDFIAENAWESGKARVDEYAGAVCNRLFETPGSEQNCKFWLEFSDFFRENKMAPPRRAKNAAQDVMKPPTVVDDQSASKARERLKKLRNGGTK